MHCDSLVIHSSDIGEPVGEFFGTAIVAVNPLAIELREIDDMQQRVRASLGVAYPAVELFPGETY